MNYLKIFLVIFLSLVASRFIPHPPNFTSLLALSFYVPVLFGRRFIPALLLSFLLTDLMLGFHNTTLFTWGSVVIVGLMSHYFRKNFTNRICGSLIGALIFYIVTNFGFWLTGYYGYSLSSLIICYGLAIPFFGYSIISTLIFSLLFETLYKIKTISSFIYNVK